MLDDGVHKHLQRARARRVLRAAGARGACERIDLSTYTPCVCARAYTCTVHTMYNKQPRIEKSRVRRVGTETRVGIAHDCSEFLGETRKARISMNGRYDDMSYTCCQTIGKHTNSLSRPDVAAILRVERIAPSEHRQEIYGPT